MIYFISIYVSFFFPFGDLTSLLIVSFLTVFFSFKLKFSIVEFSPAYICKHEYANPTTNIQRSIMKYHYINVFKMRLFYLVNLVQILSTSMIISESQSLFHKEARLFFSDKML